MEKILYLDQISIKDTLRLLVEKHRIISGSELAKKINLPVATMNRLLSGSVTDPRASTLLLIAEYFGISVDQLLGKMPLPSEMYKNDEQLKPSIKIPIFSLSEIDFEPTLHNRKYYNYLVEKKPETNSDIFAIEIKNDDFDPIFVKDTILIINPGLLPPQHGDYVLIKFNKIKQTTIKKFCVDTPNSYLSSLLLKSESLQYNPTEHTVIGIINESYTKLR